MNSILVLSNLKSKHRKIALRIKGLAKSNNTAKNNLKAKGIKMKISIDDLQSYLADRYAGWANEQGLFMKLVEEIGEVAEVLNKRAGRKATNENDLQEQLGIELVDMIHYIVAIAAINDIDLSTLMIEKDRKASIKYNHTINLETFLLEKK